MADSGPPIAPKVLQDLLLAERASRLLLAIGTKVELWEAYSIAKADAAALSAEADRVAEGMGGTKAFQEKLQAVRQGAGPLVAYLKQLIPTVLPQPPEPMSLDLSLVFVLTSPQAREKAVRWSANPEASKAEATTLLKIMGRMVESYRRAMLESRGVPAAETPVAPAAAPAPAAAVNDLEARLQARLETERRARTARIDKAKAEAAGVVDESEKAEAEKRAEEERKKAEAERAEAERRAREASEAEAAEAERLALLKEEEALLARQKADAERVAREMAESRERAEAQRKVEEERKVREEAARERAQAERQAEEERNAREKAEAERKSREDEERGVREKAEAERIARERAEAERVAREKAEAERKAREEAERKAREEAERIAREKAEAERKAREEAERVAREKAEAERKAREEAERKAREEAERKAREEAERIAREKAEAERKAREEAERKAREEAERKAREEAERIAREKAEAERKAREEAERVAREKAEAERKAREEAERKAREEAERKAREEAERIAREKAEAERKAREEEERKAREKAEAERRAREEEERKAREKAEAMQRLREKLDASLSPDQRAARDQARAALREKLPAFLADPWLDQKVGAWFRVKSVAGSDTNYRDLGLRERGKGFTMLGVQECIGGRSEWEKWERTELRQVQSLGQEILEIGGTPVECEVYQLVSKAGQEKLWVALDAPFAGAPVQSESPGRSFQARKLETEKVAVGNKEFECVKAEGEETSGGKKGPATSWWSMLFPLGPVKATGPSGSVEAVRAGENWNNRPPFPT